MISKVDGSTGHGATDDALHHRIQVLEAEATDYQRMRKRLEEEHSFREAVIERAAEGICVCHAVPDYPFVRFTVWNRRMKDLTGYSMEEINRIGWYQTVYTDPQVREKARQRMAQMREGVDLLDEQWEITRADGEKRILNISTSIIKSSDGLIHALALMQDVTNDVLYRRHLESLLKRLEGLLPICSSCKKIRDETGIWHHLETYISNHSEARFSHSICQDCATKLYPDLNRK
jgi:PAS domain S-box-containing protein